MSFISIPEEIKEEEFFTAVQHAFTLNITNLILIILIVKRQAHTQLTLILIMDGKNYIQKDYILHFIKIKAQMHMLQDIIIFLDHMALGKMEERKPLQQYVEKSLRQLMDPVLKSGETENKLAPLCM